MTANKKTWYHKTIRRAAQIQAVAEEAKDMVDDLAKATKPAKAI